MSSPSRQAAPAARLAPLLAVALLVGGCGDGAGPAPTLTLTPVPHDLLAGSAAVEVTATLSGATGTVAWSLEGPGALSSATGATVRYTPPATIAAQAPVTLTAAAAGLTARAFIRVNPEPPPPFVEVLPAAPVLTAGDDAIVLSATMTGGSGILAWSLSGPGALSATSGASVRYTPPANVSSATNAIVTASAPGLTPGQAIVTIRPGPAGTVTVVGRVLVVTSNVGALAEVEAPRPVAGARVRARGLASEAVTGADGVFRLRAVPVPYDLTAILTGLPGVRGSSYVGLTREDPTILVGLWRNRPTATVAGRLSGVGPSAFPEAPPRTDWITFRSPEAFARTDVLDHTTGDFTLGNLSSSLLPQEGSVLTGTLTALQNGWDGAGQPIFTAFGERAGVTIASTQALTGQDLVLSPIATGVVAGIVAAPAGAAVSVSGSLRWADRPQPLWFPGGAVTGADFVVATPDVAGAEVEVNATASVPSGGSTTHRLPRQPATSAGLAAVLRGPPAPLTPANSTTGVTFATPFTWTGVEGGVHVVHFVLLGVVRTELDVVTGGAATGLPDLGAFLLGSTFDPTYPQLWWVTAVGPLASVDAAASATVLPDERWSATSQAWTFKVSATP